MSILDPRTWGRKQATVEGKQGHPRVEVKQLPLGANDSLGAFLMFGYTGGTTPAGALSLYEQSTAVSVPVNKVAEGFAGLTPVLEIDGKIITSHPVLDLLNNPSPFYDGMLFAETIAKDYLITGEAEIVGLGGIGRPPLELQPISPRNISVDEGSGGLAQNIQVSGNTLFGMYKLDLNKTRGARYFDGSLRELKQIRGYSTRNNSLLRGQSPLVSACREARQHILGNTHNTSLLEKGGRLSLIFHFEDDLEPDEFEATKERVRDQYGGAGNAGQIGVTAGGKSTISEVGVNNKDMDFAKLQRMAQDSVALQYKVPLVLISTDAATFNNYKEAKLALYDDAVLPLADRLYAGLSAFLLPRFGLDPTKVKITYDMDQITALAVRRNEELKLRKEVGVETTNEMRSMIGREPVDGGNTVLAPANLLPIGTDIFTADEPTVVRDTPDED